MTFSGVLNWGGGGGQGLKELANFCKLKVNVDQKKVVTLKSQKVRSLFVSINNNNNNNNNSLFQTFVHIHNKNMIIRNTYIQ